MCSAVSREQRKFAVTQREQSFEQCTYTRSVLENTCAESKVLVLYASHFVNPPVRLAAATIVLTPRVVYPISLVLIRATYVHDTMTVAEAG